MPRKSQEQLRADWWDSWWKRDFSWDGLARQRLMGWQVTPSGKLHRSTSGGNPATLQDVWRAEADRLVVGPDGRRFTVVHAPLLWRDGSSVEGPWDDHSQEVERAFATAIRLFKAEDLKDPPMNANQEEASASPRRIPRRTARYNGFPLDGAVLQDAPDHLKALPKLRGDYVAFVGAQIIQTTPEAIQLGRTLFETDLIIDAAQTGHSDIELIRVLAMKGFALSSGKVRSVKILGLAACLRARKPCSSATRCFSVLA